jgi:hypothetical protein
MPNLCDNLIAPGVTPTSWQLASADALTAAKEPKNYMDGLNRNGNACLLLRWLKKCYLR